MSDRSTSPRHRSREAALQALYALDLARRTRPECGVQETFDAVTDHFEMPEGARVFAKELVLGVDARSKQIDELIAAHSTHWRISRMATVDRNALRLAVLELLQGEVPAAVVIDEAVELTRRFSGESSGAFVNGVLDAVARGLEPPRP